MRLTSCLFLSVLMDIIGKLDGAAITSANGNTGLMAQEFNQEMAELHGAGAPRQLGVNGMGQHNEFEWRNTQAVGTKGINGQQFFGENENEGIANGNGVNGMAEQEFGEFEGPRAFQQVSTGNANNGNWNQKDYAWGEYGWEEPNRWKRQVDFEGEGRNDGWEGTRMLNADNGLEQWNENVLGDYGNEKKKRATKMKDVNQWVMRGISHVNFADIDWAGQIARAIAKWNRMQVLANTKSKARANNADELAGWQQGTATTDLPIGDPGTLIPTTGAPSDLPPVQQGVAVGTQTSDVPIGDTGTLIPTDGGTDLPPTTATGNVMGVTDNGIIDVPVTTWSPRQIAAAADYTWGDYRPGEQPVQEPNDGIDYMVDNGQDPEFPPFAAVMKSQGGDWQIDNGVAGEQGAANEWATNDGNRAKNYDNNNADYGQGGNNRNKRAPPRVKSVNEWILQDIRKVNFADDDWLGQIAMAIAVWKQRHAADKVKAFAVDYGNPTTDTTVDMNTPGDIPLLVPVPVDLNADIPAVAAATTITNVPSSMNINAPTFEGPTTPVNVPATINAFVDDPTLGAVNVPSSVNGNTPIIVLPAVPDTTLSYANAAEDFTTVPTRNIVAAYPSFSATAMEFTNEVTGEKGSMTQNFLEPARLINTYTAVTDPNPEQTTGQDYVVTDGVTMDLNQINFDAPVNPEPWMADANKGDYGWGDYAWTENRAVKVDQWGNENNAQNNADYNYGDYTGQSQLNGADYITNGQTITPDYTGVNYATVDYTNAGKQVQPVTDGNVPAGQWKGDFNWKDYGWAGNTNDRKRREVENEGWWDKRQLKGMTNGFDYQLKSGKTKRAATINDLNKWIMSDIDKVNFGDDDWLGQIAMAIVTWRERAMAESGGQIVTNGDTPNPIDNADNGAQNVLPIDTTTPNPGWNGTTNPAVDTIPDLQFGTEASRALNAPNDANNVVDEADTQKIKAPRGLRGPWNADYVPGDYSWGKPPLVSPQNIYNGDYNWLDYALGNLLDTGNQGDYNWGAVDYIGQQPTVPEIQANPEGNGADVGFETNPKMMDGTNLFNVDYGNTDYGFDGQNQVVEANGQIKGDKPVADTGNVKQVVGEVNPDYQTTTGGTVRPPDYQTATGETVRQFQEPIGEMNPDYQTTTGGTVQINAGDRPNAGETNWQDNGWQPARQTGNANWLGDFNWGDYGWGGNTNDRKKREVENEGWWDVRKLTKPMNNDYSWTDYGLSIERAKRAATNMKIAKAVNEWVLRDINNVNFADDDWPGMIAQSIATWKRHFIKTGHKPLGFDRMPHGIAATTNGATPTTNNGAMAVANNGAMATAVDGATATANEGEATTINVVSTTNGVTSPEIDGNNAQIDPWTLGTTNGPLNAAVDVLTDNGPDGAVKMANDMWKDYGVTNTDYRVYVPETTTVKMANDMWKDYGVTNTDYRDYVPETTTFTWSTDTPVSNAIDDTPLVGEWNKQINYPDWNAETIPETNAIDGSPLLENWKRQINQAGETGQTIQATPEPTAAIAYPGVGDAVNPIRQLKGVSVDAPTGDSSVVENPNIIIESDGVPDLTQNSTTKQQNNGGLEDELNTIDNPGGLAVRAINAATNTQAESQILNNQSSKTTAVGDQRTATIADTDPNQSFTDAQIKRLKKIAVGNGVNVDGAPGDLNEINWFDYAGFGEYEGGVRQQNGGFFEEPAVQGLGAEAGNAEMNDYNWIDYGKTQQFIDYDGPGLQQGVERNAEGVPNEPDFNVFELNAAGFVDGQNDLQKLEGGNEPWQPSGTVWADYGGNRMKREVDQVKTSGRTKMTPAMSRNQRIVLVENLLKSALMGHSEDTNRNHHHMTTTHQTTNRKTLKTIGDIGARKKWLSRRLAAYNVLEGLPLRRYIVPSEIENWWTRKQINGGGREYGRNKRGVFGHKDVGHDVNNVDRRISMPDAHFRQHEFSSSLLGGKKAFKTQFTDGFDGHRGNIKDQGLNNGVIFSKFHTNDIKRSTNEPINPTFVTLGSLVDEESPVINNDVNFRASAPATMNPKPEVKERVAKAFVKSNENVQITHNVDLPKYFPRQYRDKTLGNLLDVLKIGDAGRGYIESVQNNGDRSIKNV
ncbi:hypothetical protein LOTGIDRAFT_170087 [Lottia gigantea]|uniref:Uncharacterized protein n=1 Tax=Lottia gigantea TaxID=225164 RepID=V3ZE17_LOTGI|nr:hypothetical protein LOTGIDRAFT_170087 [Lottia gigantea]ESO82307.1 hypothetical protein LOTGIDRAFT_170087 [Lottia gigantea]